MKNRKILLVGTFMMSLIALDSALIADEPKPAVQAVIEPFLVNETEKTLAKWLSISITIEGFPIEKNAYHWVLTSPDKGFSDDGTRESWKGAVTVLDGKDREVVRFNAVCEGIKAGTDDFTFAPIITLCDMTEI